ncbi:MAG: FHA domain-containing protein, partial [Polyangiaceae bacterium]
MTKGADSERDPRSEPAPSGAPQSGGAAGASSAREPSSGPSSSVGRGPGSMRIAATTPRMMEPNHVPRIELAVVQESGKEIERRRTFDAEVVRIGSHPSNDLVLDDRTVSRFHCRLTRGPRGWSISDSGSLNGVKVNGVGVRDGDLPMPECRLEIGESVVGVRDAGLKSIPPVGATLSFGGLYGASHPMRRMYDLLQRVARTDATVLIEGESGTGKELITAEIVRRGPR